MAGARKKSFELPDEHHELGGIVADVVEIADTSVSRNVFQPGAHCALGGRVVSGNRRADVSCQAHHTGVLLEGRLHIEMDDGSTLDIGPNEVFEVPPGHDGWVVSEEPMRAVNWSGVRTWLPDPQAGERILATLLFSDIVRSTEIVARIGDGAFRDLIGRHNRDVRDVLDRFRGREVNTTGDGFLAIFDGAVRAIRAAFAIRDRSRALGIEVRIGIHTGEVEVVGTDVRGIAVHEAARIAAGADAGEILVSALTSQLAAGAGLTFDDRGERELRGLDGPRRLYSPGLAP